MKNLTPWVGLVLLAAIGCVGTNSISEKAASDGAVWAARDDPAMLKAFEMARRTLPEFVDRANSQVPGTSGYSVKVPIVKGENIEYFWISPFARNGAQYSGTIANDGQLFPEYRKGQNYVFLESDIADWLYVDENGHMRGNFTACALLTHEDPVEAERFKRERGLECPDF